ncbi:hypothetical protein EMCRGX_G019605 [Ephydatia muelleri]
MTTMTSRKYQITSLYHGCTYCVMVTLIATTCVTDIKASTLTPPNVYFACENSNKYATFNCSGDGIYINWLVDGLSIHDTKIQHRNIAAVDGQVVGGYVFSALMVQTTIENNNTIVKCEIIQSLVAVESLPSVTLLLQACTQCRKTLVYSSADIARDSSVPFEVSIFAVNGAGNWQGLYWSGTTNSVLTMKVKRQWQIPSLKHCKRYRCSFWILTLLQEEGPALSIVINLPKYEVLIQHGHDMFPLGMKKSDKLPGCIKSVYIDASTIGHSNDIINRTKNLRCRCRNANGISALNNL